MTTAIRPDETTAALIAAYLRFREDWRALGSGPMGDEAYERMMDLAKALRARGAYDQLDAAVRDWQKARLDQWQRTLAGLGRKGAVS